MSRRVLGVNVTVGLSVGIPFGFALASGYPNGYEILFNFACLVFLYTFVLIHEFGHIYVIEKFGYTCRGVHLFMFGGATKIGDDMIEGARKQPTHETLIAIAGPAVSLIYAVVFGFMYWCWPNAGMLFVFAIHVAILVLNCLPIFPLDGGRVLRSLLAPCVGYSTGTKIAGYVAIIGCVALFVLGVLVGGWGLCIVSIIILFISRNEVTACLDHDHNVEVLVKRTPVSFLDENFAFLEAKYIELREQGMESHEALRCALESQFPDITYDVVLSRVIEKQSNG